MSIAASVTETVNCVESVLVSALVAEMVTVQEFAVSKSSAAPEATVTTPVEESTAKAPVQDWAVIA